MLKKFMMAVLTAILITVGGLVAPTTAHAVDEPVTTATVGVAADCSNVWWDDVADGDAIIAYTNDGTVLLMDGTVPGYPSTGATPLPVDAGIVTIRVENSGRDDWTVVASATVDCSAVTDPPVVDPTDPKAEKAEQKAADKAEKAEQKAADKAEKAEQKAADKAEKGVTTP